MIIPCGGPPRAQASRRGARDRAQQPLQPLASEITASDAVDATSLGGSNPWPRSTPDSMAISPAAPANADAAAQQRQKRSFHKELEHDAAIGRADRFAQTDFARPVRDCDQHDVDDPDCAQRQASPVPRCPGTCSSHRKSCRSDRPS